MAQYTIKNLSKVGPDMVEEAVIPATEKVD
jgi:hypothetical protein